MVSCCWQMKYGNQARNKHGVIYYYSSGHAPRHNRFFMPGLCGKRRLVSGCILGFQHFHHLVGGGGGSVLFEVAGNHKDGVPPAYLGHAVRAAGSSGGVPVGGICHRLSFPFISVFSRSIFSCAVAFLKFSPVKQTGEHISSRRS